MITPAVNPDFLAAYVAHVCPLRTPRPFPGACVAKLRPPPMDVQARIVEIAARAPRGLRGVLIDALVRDDLPTAQFLIEESGDYERMQAIFNAPTLRD